MNQNLKSQQEFWTVHEIQTQSQKNVPTSGLNPYAWVRTSLVHSLCFISNSVSNDFYHLLNF